MDNKPRLKVKYLSEIAPALKEELKIDNIHALPKLEKIVVSMGVGEAKDNSAVMDKVLLNLGALTGQKPIINKSKKAIANFKLSKGQPIGATVTLRGSRMWEFLDRLISVVLPKVRDFRGISTEAFDSQGNYSLGLREQTIFPEIDYRNVDKTRGMGISIVTTSGNKEVGKRFLELLGMPFRKG